MWFGSQPTTEIIVEETSQEVENPVQLYESAQEAVQSIFKTNKCYGILPTSCKAIVFETSIAFQLAFYALVEHDAEVAPIWEPNQRTFLGLMVMSDFIEALRVFHAEGLTSSSLANRTILEMLQMPKEIFSFKHSNFLTIDAEDSVFSMCCLLRQQESEFIPIIEAAGRNLIGILGYLDVLYLLAYCAQQFPIVASIPISQLNLINPNSPSSNNLTAPFHTPFINVLEVLVQRRIPCIPVIDDQERVVGLYSISDVSFLTRSNNPDLVMSKLFELTIGEVILPYTTDGGTTFCSCTLDFNIKDLLESMINYRVTRAVCLDANNRFMGIVDVKDILNYFLN